VSRNRLKRKSRAVVLKLLPVIREGFSVLVFPGKENQEMKFPELEKEMTRIFRKAGILI